MNHGYPWNVRVDIAGMSFEGPGMENRSEAEAIATLVEQQADVQNTEVFQQ